MYGVSNSFVTNQSPSSYLLVRSNVNVLVVFSFVVVHVTLSSF